MEAVQVEAVTEEAEPARVPVLAQVETLTGLPPSQHRPRHNLQAQG